jgi:hypothetical protein
MGMRPAWKLEMAVVVRKLTSDPSRDVTVPDARTPVCSVVGFLKGHGREPTAGKATDGMPRGDGSANLYGHRLAVKGL